MAREVRARGIVALLVTHDAEDVGDIAERVVRAKDGVLGEGDAYAAPRARVSSVMPRW